MNRARLRVVLAAVIACSPALFGASLASASPTSDTSSHEKPVAATTEAKPAVDLSGQRIQASGQRVSANMVRARQAAAQAEADKKKAAEDAAAKKKADDAKKKADDAARKKKAAEASRSAKRCTAPARVTDLSRLQTQNARAIMRAGRKMHISKRGQIIALSTALQESQLRNYANVNLPASMRMAHQAVGSDHLSVGLFQQQPNWGSLNQLMNPEISATKFYQALLRIPGWQHLPVTVAAQRVQVSAFPSAYADDEVRATAIVNALPCP
ncbi:hypothetical protein [Actinocatenispora sera]|uniref:Uncharacterized protein n=1 Tax=Actinocatenispora sera TaxID=390989 RepID=A0A810L344_9ACTN|nr:hypothetical protein [Actinocatenispora sera]BCJ29325.1 hypothetical protein Asera_34330 [Actinocatenispora sera]